MAGHGKGKAGRDDGGVRCEAVVGTTWCSASELRWCSEEFPFEGRSFGPGGRRIRI